jgi:hypothetical protein
MSVQVIFATERPAASRESAVHVFLLEMNTLVVFLQVGSKTESFRFTAAHCTSMPFAMHHRNVFAAEIVSIIPILEDRTDLLVCLFARESFTIRGTRAFLTRDGDRRVRPSASISRTSSLGDLQETELASMASPTSGRKV